jgi:chromosome segregation ATPase
VQSFGALLNIALSVLSISTLAGLGLIYGRVKGLDQRAASADAEAEALRKRVADRDEQITELTEDFTAYKAESERTLLAAKVAADTKVAQLERDLEAIGRVVTNEAHIVALQHQIEEHHAVAVTALDRIQEIKSTLVEIRDALRSQK